MALRTNKEHDFLKPYIHIEDIDGNEKPSWNFVAKIATAENCTDDCVIEAACKFNYPVYKIEAPSFCKLVVAAKSVKEDDIYDEFAQYLEGSNAVVFRCDCCKK